MSEFSISLTSDNTVSSFASLASLRATHSELLKRHRESGSTSELLKEIETFICQGRATGALLDADEDRWASQSLLDYWTAILYRAGHEPPDATLAEFDPTLAPELDDTLCPYLGLEAFREEKSSLFYGRQRLLEKLVNHLKENRLLAVVGSSGSGKSSVVLGGLLPSLKGGVLSGSENWHYYSPMVPGVNPLENLARLTKPLGVNDSEWLQQQVESFHKDRNHLTKLTNGLGNIPSVLIVDQFEEVFNLCRDKNVRQAFIENIIDFIHSPDSRNIVILIMRADFNSQLARVSMFQNLFEQAQVLITALDVSELREAIEKPAELVGLKFEEGLVEALLKDVLGEPIALPLLQFTLLKLWDNRERNRVTWETYQLSGGGRQALTLSAEEFYEKLIPEEQMIVKRMLLQIVQPTKGQEVTSNRIQLKTLYQIGEEQDDVDRVLDKLVQARLVRLTQGNTLEDTQVEIIHEALVQNWPRLANCLFNLTHSDLSAEQRVQAFRVTASPMARKLAGLLASAPVISLPIVRLIRETLLDTSQQVHVAEVFLGGLLKPLSEINVDTNPDYVQYEFMDGVRELLVDSVPSKYVLDVVDEVSKYLAKKLGISLENFAAILKNPQQVKNSEIIAEIGYFATVTSQALRRLGGEYLKLADSLESNIPINKIKSEFEEKAYLLGQQGNTKIYSFCSDKPWLLPFDVFVIPMGLEFGFGSLALSFKEWLGKNFIFLIQAIEQEKNNKNQFKISPKQPLLVALPSKINNQLFLFNNNQSQSFIICATAESPKHTIVNTGKVVESVINIAENQELKRIVIPLLGTGINNLPIDAVSHTMLSALAKSLKNSSSHQITEIIFVDKEESIINTINKVAKNIFSKKSLNEFDVPTSAKAKKESSFNKINDGITKAHADKIIRILGPRGAGKKTFMSALASWSNAKSDNPILSVSSFGGDSANLINIAKDILEQGCPSVPISRNEDADNLPIYRLLIELKSTFLITKNVRLKISYRDYFGDIFQDLRGGASSFDLTTYLDDYANSSGLLLLLDSSSIEDRQYSQALACLQTELADRLVGRNISLKSYRIAIVFNKAELNEV
ncbi:nSTAND1 domain-containing NTPase [Anabaena subtropica]|uniref:Novel STAND NTPase 1 domain-containing protein n=1 Tax=Anabaena subtropica FACHB-260 TaxID=2692884 RepID=A0ABR8CR55_9NOST|nr:hypothetical protein [Anabaena subtropica]MBD2345666.1 hypothetical protein [Anabaena subtropica FACHB-260]